MWKRRFSSVCPEALIIAGLYHDFDRIFPKDHSNDPTIRTIRRAIDTKNIPNDRYLDSIEKSQIHPENCAEIFQDYNPKLDSSLSDDISYLIKLHEVGGNRDGSSELDTLLDSFTREYNLNIAADILCEADALVFFTLIINSYAKDRPIERVQQKIRFSYAKLSSFGKGIVQEQQFKPVKRDDDQLDLHALVEETIRGILT